MAGLYDRIGPGVEDNASVHLISGGIWMVARGHVTYPNMLAVVNSFLTVPLDAAADTDLQNIAQACADLETANPGWGATSYSRACESVNVYLEMSGVPSDANWRTILNIP